MARTEMLDRYEETLKMGLLKLCDGAGVTGGEYLSCADMDDTWNRYVKDYIADAVENFNRYPEVALAWAAFLGMGVAYNWDKDWQDHRDDSYQSYYGSRGWDNMDDHILEDVLHLKKEYAGKLSETLDSCALATLGLIRHEQIEAQTEDGFFILARSYSVFFELGVTIELHRQGYKKKLINSSYLCKI